MTKKLLATSLFATCLATTALTPGQALASNDSDIYFYPKSKWSVNQINNSDNNEPAICSLTNKFNNGYIVQIRGNAASPLSMDIDFRQNIFKPEQRYKVKYSIPGAYEGQTPTKAIKENILSSDLRQEANFLDSLSNTSVIDVEIGKISFRMYMTGLSAAMQDYNECIGKSKTYEEQISSDNPTITDVAYNNKVVKSDIVDNSTVGEYNDNISVNLSNNVENKILSSQQDKVMDTDIINIAPPPPQFDEVDITDNSIAPNSLQSDSKNAADNIAILDRKKMRPSPSKKGRYTERLAKQLKEESKKYEPQTKGNREGAQNTPNLQSNETKTLHIPEIDDEVININNNSKNSGLSNNSEIENIIDITLNDDIKQNETFEIASIDSSSIDETAKMLANIEPIAGDPNQNTTEITSNDLVPLESCNIHDNNSNKEIIAMRDKISSLEKQIEKLLNKNKMLNEELRSVLKDAKEERMSVSSSNWNLELATMKFNEAERQIIRLGRKLQTQKARCEQEKAALENMLFDPELTNQNQLANLALLEEEIDRLKSESYRQQRIYEERIRLLEQQLNTQ